MLKKELIHAIEILSEKTTDPRRIKRLVDAIKSKSIEDTPYMNWLAFNLICVIRTSWPSVRNDPNNRELISLEERTLEAAEPVIDALEEYMKTLIPSSSATSQIKRYPS